MTKFNKSGSGTSTVNYEGGKAYTQKPKQELVFTTAASFIEPSFYEGQNERIERIKELVAQVSKTDPTFVANLAYILRREWHMRSSYHVLVGELAKNHKGDSLVRNLISYGSERPDDLMEIIAYVGTPIPNQVKKGIATSLKGFNEYQLAKYKGDGKNYSLVDLFNLVHPKPTGNAQKALFKRVMSGGLAIPDTWETIISDWQSKYPSKKDAWERVIDGIWIKDGEEGMRVNNYMAILRNLRNVLEEKVSAEHISLVARAIANGNAVRRSKQLPFRFLSAYRELEGTASSHTPKILDSIESAMDYSVENLPKFSGVSYITADNSGSMQHPVSSKSRVSLADIANTFLAIGNKLCDSSITTIFGTTVKAKMFSSRSGVLANTKSIISNEVGSNTYAWLAMRFLNDSEEKVDRIILLSDMQCYNASSNGSYYDNGPHGETVAGEIRNYRANINPKVKVYSIDLSGYGTLQFPDGEQNTCLLAGWSDRVFELMNLLESKSNIVEYVENHEWKPVVSKEDDIVE